MTRVAPAILLAALVALPPVLGDFQVFLLTQSLIWGIFALSMALLLGYMGQINLGQAAFVALAAYGSTLLRAQLGIVFWLAAPVTLAGVVVVAVLVGLITFRLRGPYFVLVMLGFGEIVRLIIANWQDLTGGMVGLRGIPAPEGFGLVDFGSRLGFYYLVLATVTLATMGLLMLVRSRLGHMLVAIREDEVLAEFTGTHVMRRKVTGLAISAFVAGLGGLLIGPFLTVLSPGQFSVFASVDMIVMVVVGGAGTLAGPLLGAVFLTYVPEVLGFLRDWRPILMGGLLIAVTLFLPGGLFGLVDAVLGRRASAPAPTGVKAETSHVG